MSFSWTTDGVREQTVESQPRVELMIIPADKISFIPHVKTYKSLKYVSNDDHSS